MLHCELDTLKDLAEKSGLKIRQRRVTNKTYATLGVAFSTPPLARMPTRDAYSDYGDYGRAFDIWFEDLTEYNQDFILQTDLNVLLVNHLFGIGLKTT